MRERGNHDLDSAPKDPPITAMLPYKTSHPKVIGRVPVSSPRF